MSQTNVYLAAFENKSFPIEKLIFPEHVKFFSYFLLGSIKW
jgi:hypothetical protein